MFSCAIWLLSASSVLSGCSDIEETHWYRTMQSRRSKVNERARSAVLVGLAEARADGKPNVPDDDAVPDVVFDETGLHPFVEQYGLDENGNLLGEGPHLDMLLSELELATKAFKREESKPEYLLSKMLK